MVDCYEAVIFLLFVIIFLKNWKGDNIIVKS